MSQEIYFFWYGSISETRLDVLKTCIISTKMYNPDRNVILYTNTISMDMLGNKYDIQLRSLDMSLFENIPLNIDVVKQYYCDTINGKLTLKCHPREFSDLFRVIILYKYGGSYVDTDDVCLRPINDTKNIVARCCDPHTCHYSNISHDRLMPAKYREIEGYDLPMFIRNDCWLNWEPKSDFLFDMLSDARLNKADKTLYIGDNFSFQSLGLDICNKHLENIGKTFNLRMSLLHIYEGHIGVSSFYDRGQYGGEIHDIWNALPELDKYEWSKYKCTKQVAIEFLNKVLFIYPDTCFLYLQDKDMIDAYFIDSTDDLQLMSTHIYKYIKSIL